MNTKPRSQAGKRAGKTTDADGRSTVRPKFDSMIRRALLDMRKRGTLNAYQLWKGALSYAPQMQRTAVYEFLAGGGWWALSMQRR